MGSIICSLIAGTLFAAAAGAPFPLLGSDSRSQLVDNFTVQHVLLEGKLTALGTLSVRVSQSMTKSSRLAYTVRSRLKSEYRWIFDVLEYNQPPLA